MSLKELEIEKGNSLKLKDGEPIIRSPNIKAVKQRYILTLNTITTLAFLVGIFQCAFFQVGYIEIILFLVMYFASMFGISVGFHRLFAHNSFKTTKIIRLVLAILGSMAGQGPVIYWVSTHRCHHQYTDSQGDLHSPNMYGKGIKNYLKGLWHSHFGWLLNEELANSLIFSKDLIRDPIIARINKFYLVWLLLGLFIPAFIGGLLTQSWFGAFQGFLWGGLIRLFLSFHATCAINSITHLHGNRYFNNQDSSRNNFWLLLPTVGEGLHNNHHAFPNSAKFGWTWWQIDFGFELIKILEIFGLAWNIKVPSVQTITKRLIV